MFLPKHMGLEEEASGDKKVNEISAAQAREYLFMNQSSLQERMNKINEQLEEMEKDPKMRGGKKYNSLIRSFCMISKKYTDNLEADNKLRKLAETEGRVKYDIISLMKDAEEVEEKENRLLKEENPRLLEQKLETADALKKWMQERAVRMSRSVTASNYSTTSDKKNNVNEEEDEKIEKKLFITIKDAKATKRYLVVKKVAPTRGGQRRSFSKKRVFGSDI